MVWYPTPCTLRSKLCADVRNSGAAGMNLIAKVHMFHGGLWGGWQFQVSSADEGALYFGYGGYQEARGSGVSNNHFYIENIREELDMPGEWFYDAASSELLFWPNSTQPLSESVVAASLLNTLIDVRGSPGAPVTDVGIFGFEFTGTRSTFMEMYEVPSGGDWYADANIFFLLQRASFPDVQCLPPEVYIYIYIFIHVLFKMGGQWQCVFDGPSSVAMYAPFQG